MLPAGIFYYLYSWNFHEYILTPKLPSILDSTSVIASPSWLESLSHEAFDIVPLRCMNVCVIWKDGRRWGGKRRGKVEQFLESFLVFFPLPASKWYMLLVLPCLSLWVCMWLCGYTRDCNTSLPIPTLLNITLLHLGNINDIFTKYFMVHCTIG